MVSRKYADQVEPREAFKVGAANTQQFIVSGIGATDPSMVGGVSKIRWQDTDVWILTCRQDDAEPRMIAELLALLLLSEEVPVLLRPSLNPPAPPRAVRLVDGRLMTTSGAVLEPWIHRLVLDAANDLIDKQSSYVESVCRAIRGNPPEGFTALPEGFVFSDASRRTFVAPPVPTLPGAAKAAPGQYPWYAFVRAEYRGRRYMQTLSVTELETRTCDIVLNLHQLDESGSIVPDPNDVMLWHYLERLAEVQEEFACRFGPYPAGWRPDLLRGIRLPTREHKLSELAGRAVARVGRPNPPFLVKYGERRFIHLAYSTGRLRLSPASSYRDPSLNSAIRDDELVAMLGSPHPSVEAVDGGSVAGAGAKRSVQLQAQTDCLIYCLSAVFAARLFFDFEHDACLVIRDPDEFLRRLIAAAASELPDTTVTTQFVRYYDPLLTDPGDVDVIAWKHFRYAYQREFRVSWVPALHVSKATAIDLELGPLSDICDLVNV